MNILQKFSPQYTRETRWCSPRSNYLAVSLGLVLSGCAITKSEPDTLYTRIGGAPVVAVVVSSMIDELAASPDGRKSMDRVNLPRLKRHVEELFCALANGPCTYRGENMAVAHGGLDITERQFHAIVEILRGALNQHGVGEREKNELLRLLAPMKRDIVTADNAPLQGSGDRA